MKHNLQVWIGVVFAIAIGLFVYYFNVKAPVVEAPIVENPAVVKEDSVVGCYVAKLSKDVYVLKISSDTNGNVSGMLAINNYEKDSSSGSFIGTYKDGILLGDYYFNSEGMDSVMQVIFKKTGDTFVRGYGSVKSVGDKVTFENLADITYDSSYAFIKSTDCMEKFSEVNNKFTFSYNPFFKTYQPQEVLSIDWRTNTQSKGTLLASVTIPKSYMPKTNFGDARFTIGVSTNSKEIKTCTTTATNGEIKGGLKTISGYPFTTFTLGDAGAGNFYETTSYRGLLDGDCYAIEYTIHSTNIGSYSQDQGIKEFDKANIQSELENMIAGFKLLVNSN